MAKRKSNLGRPSSFKPRYVDQGRKLAELGATDREIGEFFKVSDRTILRWQHDFPDFCRALKVGKEAADERVIKSLYRRAVGYTHDAVKIFNEGGKALKVAYEEHHPPDVTACIFWLKNRRPADWRDRLALTNGEGNALIPEPKAHLDEVHALIRAVALERVTVIDMTADEES